MTTAALTGCCRCQVAPRLALHSDNSTGIAVHGGGGLEGALAAAARGDSGGTGGEDANKDEKSSSASEHAALQADATEAEIDAIVLSFDDDDDDDDDKVDESAGAGGRAAASVAAAVSAAPSAAAAGDGDTTTMQSSPRASNGRGNKLSLGCADGDGSDSDSNDDNNEPDLFVETMAPFVEHATAEVETLREHITACTDNFGRLARLLGAATADGAAESETGDGGGGGIGPEELFGSSGLGGFVAALADARERNVRRRIVEEKARKHREAEARAKATALLRRAALDTATARSRGGPSGGGDSVREGGDGGDSGAVGSGGGGSGGNGASTHGGASRRVSEMFGDLKRETADDALRKVTCDVTFTSLSVFELVEGWM